MELDPLLRRLHSPAERGTYSKYVHISELFKSSYVYHIMCVGRGERSRGDSRKSDIFVPFHLFLTKKYENFDSKYYFVSALLSLGNSSTARKCDGSIIVLFDPFPSLFYFLLYRSYFHSFFRFLICLVFLPPSFFTPR